MEPTPRRGGDPCRRRRTPALRLDRFRTANQDAPGRRPGGTAPGGRRGEHRHVRRRERHVPPAHAHHPLRADAAQRRLRLRTDHLRGGAGPHPVLRAGVRRRQAHAAGPRTDRRPLLLAGSAAIVGGGFVLFATARSNLAELLAAMGVLGFGVGSFSAAMPGVILAVTPKSETSSAMSFNYVVRSVGYSLGSAIGGLVLAAGTATGRLFPNDDAYTTAALVGVAAMAITTMASLALARRRSPETNPIAAPVGVPGLGRSSRTGS
ncbi:MFS transporter [Streptomyces decoyicus]|uniref:MFS transporter n=1 Tax=Streptomyces decoyicus TaxID=249567 RepID=UPI002E17B913|nr:MFS transporter [Streptomyces decoyicus]